MANFTLTQAKREPLPLTFVNETKGTHVFQPCISL